MEQQYVVIEGDDGREYTYLHMSSVQVIENENVWPGKKLGKVSNRNNSGVPYTTRHLHFEVETTVPGYGTTAASPYMSLVEAYRRRIGVIDIGDSVRAVAGFDIFNSAGGAVVGHIVAGATGHIVSTAPSPINKNGFCWKWWKIDWDNGLQGWSVDNYILAEGSDLPPPSNLNQLAYNGSEIPQGATIDPGTVAIIGNVSSPGNQVRLEVAMSGVDFGSETRSSPLVNSNTTTSICFTGLPNGAYSWRARTVREDGLTSAWVAYNGVPQTSINFTVQSLGPSCVACSTIAGVVAEPAAATCGTPLAVTLSPSPSSGTAPLNDVDLTASVSGSVTGTINYTFYCNRADGGTNITSGYAAKYDGITANPKAALNVCDYSVPGTYTAKVIVERGASAAESRATITVGQSSPQAPTVTTSGATNVTQGSATLNLSVDPRGNDTSVWFDWGNSSTSFCCSTSQQTVLGAAGATLLSMSIGGLSCDTTYYYRARAQNPGGGATGSTLSFKTNSCGGTSQTIELVADPSFEAGNNAWWVASPAFYIDHAPAFPNARTGSYYGFLSTSSGSAGNNLEGGVISPQVTIPANTTSAQLRFWHSVTTQETTTSLIFDKLEAYFVRNGTQTTLLTTVSNLDKSGTQYLERIVNVPSSFFGQTIQIFFRGTTDFSNPTVFRMDDVTLKATLPAGGAPSVSTQGADQVSASSARLNMTVNPNGASTTVWFNLEAGDSTPDNETEHIAIGSDTGNEAASISTFNLQCGTLYYFRANASNAPGSAQGGVQSFTTGLCGSAPEADTDPAVDITATSASLTADVNPHGLATQAWFAWGTSPSFGQETTHLSVGSGNGFTNFTQSLSGLSCGTTYYFQNRASNSVGQASGATLSFTTTTCTPTLPVVSIAVIDTTATEAGLTSGAFRLSRTGNLSQALYLGYSVTGVASYGEDYEEFPVVFFPASSASIDITVQPRQDTLVEGDETVVLTIQPQSTYDVGNPSSATVTITSDDVGGDCYVSVISPVGGETWVKGVPQKITWSAGPGCLDYAFELVRDGTFDGFIGSADAVGDFTWVPQAWLMPGSDLQIEVVGFDADGQGFSDRSNSFSLVNQSPLPSVLFEDSFDDNTDHGWHSYSAPWGGISGISHSPPQSKTTAPFYFQNTIVDLTSPFIDVSGRQALEFSFWHRSDIDPVDVGRVVVEQGGSVFVERTFAGDQSEWMPVTIDLGKYAGGAPIRIGFELVTHTAPEGSYWFVDDVLLREPRPTDFYTLDACRVVDTRQGLGSLSSGIGPKAFPVAGTCGVPANAKAVSVNVTAVSPTSSGNMRLFPSDRLQPNTSTINFEAGKNRANNALLGLSADGRLSAVMGGTGQVDLVVDVNGYFAESTNRVNKDIWTTSVYSYAPGGQLPGGGRDDHQLLVGGWGDEYYSLLEFDLTGLPSHASSARLELYCYQTPETTATPMYLDRITQFWDWRIQGTGRDRERLWWADRPSAELWRPDPLPAPTGGAWYSIDITDLYNAWKSGTVPNYGLQLRPVNNWNDWSQFYSSNHDNPALRPQLVVVE
jgi:hypothetical protein